MPNYYFATIALHRVTSLDRMIDDAMMTGSSNATPSSSSAGCARCTPHPPLVLTVSLACRRLHMTSSLQCCRKFLLLAFDSHVQCADQQWLASLLQPFFVSFSHSPHDQLARLVDRSRWRPHVVGGRKEPFDGVVLGPLLGKGSFGRVYRALWDGKPVAVKVRLMTGQFCAAGQLCAMHCRPPACDTYTTLAVVCVRTCWGENTPRCSGCWSKRMFTDRYMSWSGRQGLESLLRLGCTVAGCCGSVLLCRLRSSRRPR